MIYSQTNNQSSNQTSVSRSNIVLLILILILIIAIVLGVELNAEKMDNNRSGFILFQLTINGILGTICLIRGICKYSYSASSIHWLFYLFFFVIAPYGQYSYQSWPWGYSASDGAIIYANAYVLIWGLGYLIGYEFIKKKKRDTSNRMYKQHFNGVPIQKASLMLFVIIDIVITIYMVLTIGISNLMVRSSSSFAADTTAYVLLLNVGLRAFSTFTVAFCIVRYKQFKDCKICIVISIICLLICCFPTGIARYAAGAIYGGLLLLTFIPFRKQKGLFYILFIFVFISVFTTIGNYRTSVLSMSNLLSNSNDSMSTMLLSNDYDAYSVILWSIDYVSLVGVSLGNQLIGALAFFIPRSIWPAKAYGTGRTIFQYFGMPFTNISCPPIAEGYVNFGIAGIIIFALVFGIVGKLLDTKYWENRKVNLNQEFSVIDILYPYLILFFFFMCRGDLQSSLAFTLGFSVICIIMALINKWIFLLLRKPRVHKIDPRHENSGGNNNLLTDSLNGNCPAEMNERNQYYKKPSKYISYSPFVKRRS